MDLTAHDTEDQVVARHEDDTERWSMVRGRSPPPTVPALSGAVRAVHGSRFAPLSDMEVESCGATQWESGAQFSILPRTSPTGCRSASDNTSFVRSGTICRQ